MKSTLIIRPADKKYVKENMVTKKWDTDFVCSEINSVIRYYVPWRTGRTAHPFIRGYFLARELHGAIGVGMVTKEIGTLKQQQITTTYKPNPPKQKFVDTAYNEDEVRWHFTAAERI